MISFYNIKSDSTPQILKNLFELLTKSKASHQTLFVLNPVWFAVYKECVYWLQEGSLIRANRNTESIENLGMWSNADLEKTIFTKLNELTSETIEVKISNDTT